MTKETLLQRDIKMLKEHQNESVKLLKVLATQVGTHYGEQIDEHIALLTGARFDAKAWDLRDFNGEQGV